MISQSSLKAISKKICVVYDPKDGRIVHTHCTVTLHGGREVADEECVVNAKHRAKQAGHDISGLESLYIGTADYDHAANYRVDVENQSLIKLERPERQ